MQVYSPSLTSYQRLKTREVKIGSIIIGGNHPIRIQTMTTTDTMDTMATVEQSIRCIEAGAELNIKGEHGFTPLHEAVQQGHLDVARLLLSNGASNAVKNHSNQTPADLAQLQEDQEMLTLLQLHEALRHD